MADYSIEFFKKVFYVVHLVNDEKNVMYSTCYQYVRIGTVPSLCLWNGLNFPEVPDCLKRLYPIKERLLALRIPFMQIKQLGHERQCGLKGQIVNVPISFDTTIKSLPRSPNDTHVIQLHIKRKMEFSHD